MGLQSLTPEHGPGWNHDLSQATVFIGRQANKCHINRQKWPVIGRLDMNKTVLQWIFQSTIWCYLCLSSSVFANGQETGMASNWDEVQKDTLSILTDPDN